MTSGDEKIFDVFLSHKSVDKPWAIKLKDDLGRYGVSVWLDQDEIRPGDLFAKALEQGLEQSRAVALIVSPEAMASGWVEEEYYRALSLAKDKATPLQLIPVILRQAAVPGFAKSRNWVDFRDEANYGENVWKLVWGITGRKPAKVLDLTAPPAPSRLTAEVEAGSAPLPQPEVPRPSTGFRSGGIKARKIQTENLITGVKIESDDAETIQATQALIQDFEAGDVEAKEELIVSRETVTGVKIGGRGGPEITIEEFRQELAALREQLAQAIAAGEIEDEEEAEDAELAIERVAKQLAAESPSPDKISTHLDRATIILTKASEAAQAAGKVGATVIKLAPIVAGLRQLVEQIF